MCIDSIASIAGRPKRLGTYRTGRPRSAPIRSAWTSSVVKSSFPGRDWCASSATFAPRTSRGGPSALKQLLLDLKKYSFSGYVRTVRSGGGKRAEGIVLLRGGNPEASLYHRDGTEDRGRSALKKVWQDSYDESCVLELHARVDMDGLVREYTNAILERPAKVVKKTKIPQTMERSDIEKQIRAWKDRGYDVSSVESNLEG